MSEEYPIREGQVVTGSLFSEPMRVETVRPLPAAAGAAQAGNGPGAWVAGLVGMHSERFRRVTLNAADIEKLTILDAAFDYGGDGQLLRLGIQAYSLGIAYEFDPYFGLSISRVDPLPHQLEAIYDYDITSLDLSSGELRLIEVKGLGDPTGTILLTPNERRVAEDRRDCYWLYVVTNCGQKPTLQEPIRDPARFPWHEVKKVQHYWLEVNAMTQPMQVREDSPEYGIHRGGAEDAEGRTP